MLKESTTSHTNNFPASTTPPPPPLSTTRRSGRHAAGLVKGPASAVVENNGTIRRKTRSSAALGEFSLPLSDHPFWIRNIIFNSSNVFQIFDDQAAPELDTEVDGVTTASSITVPNSTATGTASGAATASLITTSTASAALPDALLAPQPGPAVGGACSTSLNSANNKRRRVSRDSRWWIVTTAVADSSEGSPLSLSRALIVTRDWT